MPQFSSPFLNPLVNVCNILYSLLFSCVRILQCNLESFVYSILESVPVSKNGDCCNSYKFSCFTHAFEFVFLSIWTSDYYAGRHIFLIKWYSYFCVFSAGEHPATCHLLKCEMVVSSHVIKHELQFLMPEWIHPDFFFSIFLDHALILRNYENSIYFFDGFYSR